MDRSISVNWTNVFSICFCLTFFLMRYFSQFSILLIVIETMEWIVWKEWRRRIIKKKFYLVERMRERERQKKMKTTWIILLKFFLKFAHKWWMNFQEFDAKRFEKVLIRIFDLFQLGINVINRGSNRSEWEKKIR